MVMAEVAAVEIQALVGLVALLQQIPGAVVVERGEDQTAETVDQGS
jgi:hypothetical protein